MATEWRDKLHAEAGSYARLALKNIGREFPAYVIVMMNGPGDFPARPRDRTPVFFGSLDWHSCVEMHWVLVRLLKVAGDAVPAAVIRAALDAQFTARGLRAEADFMATSGSSQRPYGWGWALTLAHELASWDDPDSQPGCGDRERRAALVCGGRRLARGVPARPRLGGAGVPVHPRHRLGRRRRPDRAPARAQPQPGLVLAPPRRDPARRRHTYPGLPRGRPAARRGVAAPRHHRRLHGHPLARRLRRPARHRMPP